VSGRSARTIFDEPGSSEDPFVRSLGTVFESGNTYLKPFAACRLIHAAAGAFERIVTSEGLESSDIESVEVSVPTALPPQFSATAPCTVPEAQFSFPFVLAALALHGRALAEEVSERELANPRHLQYCERISLAADPRLDRAPRSPLPARVAVRTTDGRLLTHTSTTAPGDPSDPMTGDELRDKFLTLATPKFGAADAAVLADELMLDPSMTTRRVNDRIARAVSSD